MHHPSPSQAPRRGGSSHSLDLWTPSLPPSPPLSAGLLALLFPTYLIISDFLISLVFCFFPPNLEGKVLLRRQNFICFIWFTTYTQQVLSKQPSCHHPHFIDQNLKAQSQCLHGRERIQTQVCLWSYADSIGHLSAPSPRRAEHHLGTSTRVTCTHHHSVCFVGVMAQLGWSPRLSFTYCVSLGRFLSLSEPQLPHL